MCNLSDVLVEKGIEQGIEKGIEQGIEKGIEQGIEQGIEALILDYLENGKDEELIVSRLEKRFQITRDKAKAYFDKYSKI